MFKKIIIFSLMFLMVYHNFSSGMKKSTFFENVACDISTLKDRCLKGAIPVEEQSTIMAYRLLYCSHLQAFAISYLLKKNSTISSKALRRYQLNSHFSYSGVIKKDNDSVGIPYHDLAFTHFVFPATDYAVGIGIGEVNKACPQLADAIARMPKPCQKIIECNGQYVISAGLTRTAHIVSREGIDGLNAANAECFVRQIGFQVTRDAVMEEAIKPTLGDGFFQKLLVSVILLRIFKCGMSISVKVC
jgi:hypothetical protein